MARHSTGTGCCDASSASRSATPRRSPLLPHVPTFEESDVRGYSADAWYGLLAPAGTPPAVLQALEKVAAQFAAAPGTAARLTSLGMDSRNTCGAAFGAMLQADTRGYTRLARDLNLKAE
ncbi:tripartite tricarboxylate transporter substrate-binding protein [Ramlibacter aurantiacus]|uniref:tripartite tricarboxylate transporter substrate-binding protein n=1 Tax=Ramlibacter aurantiacus TaxID=2801330 RepID=UPI002108341D|nr:tripartite tricarboxylate transporter substrate-binding protein [Ramlibacter aurantiacus]